MSNTITFYRQETIVTDTYDFGFETTFIDGSFIDFHSNNSTRVKGESYRYFYWMNTTLVFETRDINGTILTSETILVIDNPNTIAKFETLFEEKLINSVKVLPKVVYEIPNSVAVTNPIEYANIVERYMSYAAANGYTVEVYTTDSLKIQFVLYDAVNDDNLLP